ncbi:ABC transporter substrate-binding protein [Lipingzhangella sp. LS1_29]|uniref:ABC transporter substrate-binding protein n=1 Tax=Lipingzhangella rawalii TaxID=2055835 RepID=A0ABU2H8M9_9ACTN|nr:ABC transporter substrate-binding protein [Lipingzhangella rawalii]MDS1271352.1 ABC transporter substrate-binding protein [Lipingzhangella rawalii]
MARRQLRMVAVTSAAAVLLSACAGAGDVAETEDADLDVSTGVTDDTVTIGTHSPLTGPASPGYSSIPVGAEAVFDYANDQGGIHDREIEYIIEDDVYDPTNTVEVTEELIHREEIFAMVGGLGTPTHSQVIDTLNNEGVPDLFVSSGALLWNKPEEYPLTYGYQVDYTREGKIQGEYIAENFPDADVGYLQQGDDIADDAAEGLNMYLEDQVVAEETYEPGEDAIDEQMEALATAEAEVVVCSCVPNYVAMMVLTAESIGYEPQFVVSSIGGDTVFLLQLLQEFTDDDVPASALLEGLIATGYLPQAEQSDDPWVALFADIHEEYIPDEPFTDTLLYGMVQGVKFVQLLEEAGEDLTRQTLIDTINDTELSGPGLVPFVAEEGDHSGFTGAYVSEFVDEGQVDVVQEPMVTGRDEGDEIETFDLQRPTPDGVEPFASW